MSFLEDCLPGSCYAAFQAGNLAVHDCDAVLALLFVGAQPLQLRNGCVHFILQEQFFV